MPKQDWERVDKYCIKHKEKNATVAIYGDGVLLFVDDKPVGEMLDKVSEAIKYYDDNYR